MSAIGADEIDWASEFAKVIACAKCSRTTDPNMMRDDHENVPQPGYVGASYSEMRLLLVGQNPWLPNSSLVTSDRVYTAALRFLRDFPSQRNYAALAAILDQVIPSWPVQNRTFPLDECGVSLDQIAYLNIVRCRTGETAPREITATTCVAVHFERWLEHLNPSCVVFIGLWARDHGRLSLARRGIPFATIDRNRFLTREQRAANRAQVAAFVRATLRLEKGERCMPSISDNRIGRPLPPPTATTDPKYAIRLLADLQKLGFNDEVFWRVHHHRRKNEKERIVSFRAYCEKTNSFQAGGTNERVGQRLAYVLNHYRASGLAPGETRAMIDLAEAAFREIP